MVKNVSWQALLADGYTNPKQLLHDLGLPDRDVSADTLFKTRVPKSFAEKMQHGNPNDPLLLQVLPTSDEFTHVDGFTADPLSEQQFNPLSGLLHKYQTRVLLTFRGACAINCRYCFRRHFDYADNRINDAQLSHVIDYIQAHPHVNEVILSGGDPLMAKDAQLKNAIAQFATLPQLKRLRIHSRLPVVIPERITDELVTMLSATRLKTVMVLHSNHANELDEHFAKHIKRLIDNGVQVFNQSVLLKNINDNADSLVSLSEKLFDYGILPYYLFVLDKVSGAAHFNVDENQAKQLIREMAAQLPGYLVPKLARETAGMTSKDMWV